MSTPTLLWALGLATLTAVVVACLLARPDYHVDRGAYRRAQADWAGGHPGLAANGHPSPTCPERSPR